MLQPEPDSLFPRLAGWWRGFVVAPLEQAGAESRAFLNTKESHHLDGKVLTVLVTTALVLSLQFYVCRIDEIDRTLHWLEGLGFDRLTGWVGGLLGNRFTHQRERLTWWAVGSFLLYFVVPALIVRFGFREPLADYGVKRRGAFADGWVYPLFFAVVGPLVLLVSRDPHFQETYPFYQPRDGRLGPDFWCWELLYTLQFFGLEFFFRGFLVQGLRHRFGPYTIAVMMVPYCMIHFGKPLPETLAAIVAGLALGFMSLKTRSILLGAAIHVSVALSMDLASLWRQGFFG